MEGHLLFRDGIVVWSRRVRCVPGTLALTVAAMRGVYLGDLTWPEAKAWIDAGRVVVVPIGAAAKEHGHHLPLKTDYMLAEALSRGVAEALPVIVAPVIGFGYYPAFRHYPGSQHLSPETFSALLRDILEGFIVAGRERGSQ